METSGYVHEPFGFILPPLPARADRLERQLLRSLRDGASPALSRMFRAAVHARGRFHLLFFLWLSSVGLPGLLSCLSPGPHFVFEQLLSQQGKILDLPFRGRHLGAETRASNRLLDSPDGLGAGPRMACRRWERAPLSLLTSLGSGHFRARVRHSRAVGRTRRASP